MEWRLCPGCGTLKILGPIYSWPTLSLGEGGSSPERQTEKTLGWYVLPPHFHQGLRDFARREKQALKTLATNLFPKVVTSFAADYGEVYA